MSKPCCISKTKRIYNDHEPSQDDGTWAQHAQKISQAQQLLRDSGRDNNFESMEMIDAIQRLAIDYYFEKEIEEILEKQWMMSRIDDSYWQIEDLHEVSLRFRLFRQHGHHVSAEVFSNFKNNEGKFNPKLRNDIKGLMSLFEASQHATQGEEDRVLVDAGDWSHHILHAWLNNHLCVDDIDHQARAVEHTLRLPYHKSLARFGAKQFLANFHGSNDLICVLKEVAILDNGIVKTIHRREIQQISEWWKSLGLGKEVKYGRCNIVKWHMWSMAVLTDPRLSQQRLEITKLISLAYIIDDIFDVCGTLDQLTLFTHVVNRWEYDAIEELPNYMQLCVKALFDTTKEFGHKIYEMHGWNPIECIKNAWKRLCNAFLVEAKWFATGELPSADEYLTNGIVSSGVHVPLIHMFFLLGHNVTPESVQLVDNFPQIISSVATIFRLWDDFGTAQDENQKGHDGSYINYYMKENNESCIQFARQHVMDMISESWKCLNHACVSHSYPFSRAFVEICLNIARMVPLMYGYDEKHNLPNLEKYMKSLLA